MSKNEVLRMLEDLEQRVESADEYELSVMQSAFEEAEAVIMHQRSAA